MISIIGNIKTTSTSSASNLFILVFSILLSASFFIINEEGYADDTTPPYVVSTNPADGASNVSVNLSGVSITFNEEMNGSSSNTTEVDFWGPFSAPVWSQDMQTLTIPRISQDPIPVGVTMIITVWNLRDAALNPLDHPGNSPGYYIFSFMIGTDVDEIPSVVSTDPTDGATGVSRDLQTVSMHFSEPMNDCCASIQSNFPSFSMTWSADHKTLSFTRNDLQSRLTSGATYTFIASETGYYIRDTQGNSLPETTFSFTIEENYDYQLSKIPANSSEGFEWAYYLSIPNQLSTRTILLIEPNNTGNASDDLSLHDQKAEELARWRSDFAVSLDVPLLVPTFPRPINPPAPEPGGIYTHALDRYSLLTDAVIDGKSIERVDLQLVAMIRDAQQRLTAMGYEVNEKVFMMGYSASGAFTSRFTLLHPEIVKAAAPGSPGGWPLAPVSSWQGTTLRYPVGIADIETISGTVFDLSAFRNVPQYIYVGDLDRNDALDIRGFPQDEVDAICALLDCRPDPYISDRWPISEQMYSSENVSNQFVIYPGVAHSISGEMFNDLLKFFRSHKLVGARVNPGIHLLLLGY
jgi:hypothetical protein